MSFGRRATLSKGLADLQATIKAEVAGEYHQSLPDKLEADRDLAKNKNVLVMGKEQPPFR